LVLRVRIALSPTTGMSQELETKPPPSLPLELINLSPCFRELGRDTIELDPGSALCMAKRCACPQCRDTFPDSMSTLHRFNSRSSEGTKKSSTGHTRIPLWAGFKPSLVLKNSGSVARDHVAAERTFLAYVRTSLVIVTTAVALVQLLTTASNPGSIERARRFVRPLGAALVIVGLGVLAVGVRRYFVIQTALTKGLFPATQRGAAGITIVVALLVVVVFAFLVLERG